MKKSRRILAFVLSMVMCLSLLPANVLTVSAATTTKNIMLGTSHLKGGMQSNIYFGRYQQSSAGSTQPSGTENVDWIKSTTATENSQGPYYYKDPIKWRVLSNADGKAFLLSDTNLDVVKYHEDKETVTWETSTMRSWLNGYGASSNQNGVDYSNSNEAGNDNFIGSAFSASEQAYIASTNVINATYDGTENTNPNPSYSTSGGNDTTDKIFLLSIAEAKNTAYGFTNSASPTDTRKSVNTYYVYGGGHTGTYIMRGVDSADYWWLRSPGRDTYAAYAGSKGYLYKEGYFVSHQGLAVRPAFNLNLSSVLFTSAASGGKPTGFNSVANYSGNDWKLTFKDSSRNFSVSDTSAKTVKAGDKLSFNFSNATTGSNEYVSAMLVNSSDDVVYYGQLAKATSASGTATLTVPADIQAGTYTLNLFNEQINGDYKTDYASGFVTMSVTIPAVTFDKNGGDTEAEPKTKAAGTGFPTTNPTRNGYIFDSWYTKNGENGDWGNEFTAETEVTEDITVYAKWLKAVTFDVSNTEHTYKPNEARKITFTPSALTADDFTVQYYEVDENNGVLKSTSPVDKAITGGKYLYVIDFKDNTYTDYIIQKQYAVTDTTIPDDTQYDNTGFMYISNTAEQQEPIYFENGAVSLKVGETYTNTLTGGNAVTYKSSNSEIASVDETTGEVTALKAGTVTITATSEKEGTTPVYASYTVTIRKELTTDDFVIGTAEKTYDGTTDATVTATVETESLSDNTDIVNVTVTASYDTADSGENKTVNYEIIGISGKNADKYVLADNMNGTTTGKIDKAKVTIICAETTTRTYDGNPQSVDVSAMANGKVFDKSNYTVKYNNADTATEVYVYEISVELTEEAAKNYEVEDFYAILKIVPATQEVFSVEDVPEVVYYGDTFTVSTYGANGTVTYEITNGEDIADIDITSGAVTITGVGKVTIKATSTLDGYTDRYATKTFEVKKRILTPTATATDRTYNGENGVEVAISLNSDEIIDGDTITAEATGTMINADAGNDKLVYVSGITLNDNTNYTLSTTTLQTTVDITKKAITGVTITASDKKYDGSEIADVTVTDIEGLLEADKGQVEVIGTAVFDNADSGTDKTVTFTASGLSGAKAENYTLTAMEATATANITPLSVDFVVGNTAFVYDGSDKKISVSASDEFGRIFTEYSVEYNKTPNAVGTYTATVKLNDNTNYTTTQGEITITISEATQDNLVIVGLPGTIQYGDSFTLEAVGGADGGTYEWTVKDNADVTLSTNNEAETTVTIGEAVGDRVEIEVVKKTDNYEDISAKVVFVPTAKAVTFDISNLEQTYGAISDVEVTPSDTNVSEDDYTITYNGGELPENAGTYTVKVKTKDESNYSGMQTATLSIKKATAAGTITGIDDTYTYGDTITNVDVENLLDGTSATIKYAGTGIYVPQAEAPTKVGYYTVIAEITGDNYEKLTVTENFVIEKKELRVKADDAIRAYGEANPIFTLSYDGFVNGETKDVLLAEPVATATANASSGVDEYEIKVSGGSAENYKFIYDNTGKLTVTGATGGSLYITGSTNTAYVNDVFGLHAFYGNSKVDVTWESSDNTVAEITANGTVTAKKAGTVTIKATADANYGNATATFTLTVKQTGITLVPTELVKTYTGERQDISFADNADFDPVLSGEGKNVDVKYTLISNPSVTEPVQAGTYSVVYTISDGSYTGGGNTTMYINKATVTAKVKDDSKVYGDEYSAYDLEFTNNGTLAESIQASVLEEIKGVTTFASEGADKTAAVKDSGYEIIPTLSKTQTDNVIFTVEKGTLTVTKAPLTVKVKDVTREYGAENPTLEAEYTGFKNEETENTENIFTGELTLTYDESINADTTVGEYADKTTAGGIDSANYDITFVQGKVTVTKIAVTASAGTSRSSYLTVKFDKAVEGVTFTVTDGTNPVEITEVTASSDNKTYTLKGTFSTSVTYTVTPALTSETHEIVSEALSIKPTSSGGGGGGGGGSSAPTTYTVKFETNGGSEIDSVKVTKNGTVNEPTAPTKDGYTFDGWYTDKELTKAYDFETKVTKSFTLYAKWTENKADDTDDKTDGKDDKTEWENPFDDVKENDWYYADVEYALENGLFNGTGESTFAPNGIITRAMMVTVLYRNEGQPEVTGKTTFEDVDANAYYAKAVVWGQQNGIIKGYSETEFAPNQNITREQIAAIMHRYAKFKGYDVSVGENTNILSYDDFDSISEYAIASMQYAVGSGLMKGKSNTTLNPLDNATRAEIAAILHRFIEANK